MIDSTKGLPIDSTANFNKVIVSMGYDSITTNITLVAGYGTMLPDPSFSGSYDLAYIDASNNKRLLPVTTLGAVAGLDGSLWIDGNYLYYIASGIQRYVTI